MTDGDLQVFPPLFFPWVLLNIDKQFISQCHYDLLLLHDMHKTLLSHLYRAVVFVGLCVRIHFSIAYSNSQLTEPTFCSFITAEQSLRSKAKSTIEESPKCPLVTSKKTYIYFYSFHYWAVEQQCRMCVCFLYRSGVQKFPKQGKELQQTTMQLNVQRNFLFGSILLSFTVFCLLEIGQQEAVWESDEFVSET